jgi:serine/threonine protein kinase
MNCPNPKSLQQLLDETLPADEQPTIQAHLETCERCQKVVEHLAAGGATWDRTAQNLTPVPMRDETALFNVVEKLQDTPKSPDPTQAEAVKAPHDEDLSFLQPSTKPDSLGRLDEYEILSIVGKGGFGIVLKAFDEELHRIVAIKVLSPSIAANGTARQRFIREAISAAAIMHENVVTIYRVNKTAKIPYLVMQFVSGFTLNDKIESTGALSLKEILRIGTQTAEGLVAAHKQGLIHRDIKPANILLENGVERVKITDFGLARLADDASVTQSGVIAGTPMFMSPEQADGQPIDLRSDLFSLGSVLYVMCTGKAPFRATSTMAVMKRVCEETPRPIHESNPELPSWLGDLIAKLHAKKPGDRFQTAQEVAELLGQRLADLQAGRAEPRERPGEAPVKVDLPSSRKHQGPDAPRSPARRRWVAALVVFVIMIVLLPIVLIAIGVSYFVVGHRAGVQEEIVGNRPVVQVADNDGWIQLFNGKDLTGWVPRIPPKLKSDSVFQLMNGGVLFAHGTTTSPAAGYLRTAQTYDDFILDMECESNVMDPFNKTIGGLLFQIAPPDLALPAGDGSNLGILMNIPPGNTDGFIRANAASGSKDLMKNIDWREFKSGWNHLQIESGPGRFVVALNGKQLSAVNDFQRKKGYIGIWAYATGMRYRNIRIKELRPSPPLAIAPFDAAKAKEHQNAWAKHLGVESEITNSIGMKLRLIPPGEFTAGTAADDMENLVKRMAAQDMSLESIANVRREVPPVQASVKQPFYLGTCEVTMGQFRAFVEATKYQTDGEKSKNGGWSNRPGGGWLRHPDHIWKTPGPWKSEETVKDAPRYTAVALKEETKKAWQFARVPIDDNQHVDDMRRQEFVAVAQCVYRENSALRQAYLWASIPNASMDGIWLGGKELIDAKIEEARKRKARPVYRSAFEGAAVIFDIILAGPAHVPWTDAVGQSLADCKASIETKIPRLAARASFRLRRRPEDAVRQHPDPGPQRAGLGRLLGAHAGTVRSGADRPQKAAVSPPPRRRAR